MRVGILAGMLACTVLIIFLEGGHVDSTTGEAPTFLDAIYFTAVTITTVGYGDIVPVSRFARMMDAFVLTPMRLIVFVLFVGIAYELAFKRWQESYRMYKTMQHLNNHIIVCGFGETGAVAVEELLAGGIESDQIVVLETDVAKLDEAAKIGVVAVNGDASKERVLKSVAVERAKHVLICPGRDDSTVLIALTVQELNSHAQLVAMCHHEENIRLIRRSGVRTIISPAGGNMFAAATRQPHLVETMHDLMALQGSIYLDERFVKEAEVGKLPSDLKDIAVVRVYRDGTPFNLSNFPTLESRDVLVYVDVLENGPAA